MSLLLAAILLFQGTPAEQLIQDLRSDNSELRERARKELRKLGKVAIPVLEKAAKDADPDLSRSSQEILKEILSAEADREALRSGLEKHARGDFEGAMADFTKAIDL